MAGMGGVSISNYFDYYLHIPNQLGCLRQLRSCFRLLLCLINYFKHIRFNMKNENRKLIYYL